METAALITVVAGILTTVIGGVLLALVSKIFNNFGQDLQDFKADVDNRFERLEKDLSLERQFRENFQTKGWDALPPDMNTAPALASTISVMQDAVNRLIKIGEKLDQRIQSLDKKVQHVEDEIQDQSRRMDEF
jgi:peptidoglycan hydrolase CwlO-like protein